MAKKFYFNTINLILTSYIENLLSGSWLYYKSWRDIRKRKEKKCIKSNVILLLDNGIWVQDVLKHGTTNFYNCRMIWKGGPGPPGPPLNPRRQNCLVKCGINGLAWRNKFLMNVAFVVEEGDEQCFDLGFLQTTLFWSRFLYVSYKNMTIRAIFSFGVCLSAFSAIA